MPMDPPGALGAVVAMSLTRRRFLGIVGKGAALSALGLGAGIWWIQPRRSVLAAPKSGLPTRATAKKRVVVVGGGLAGIAAATELAERGFAVTLLERAGGLGGKLAGWPVTALGRTFPMEHGFHGFFRQYYNLNSLLGRAGAERDLQDAGSYPILFGDRSGAAAEERFGTSTSIFPANLLSVIARSPSLHLGDFREDGPGLVELMRWRGDKTYAARDGESFAEFIARGRIHRGMVDTVLRPFGKTSLNALERFSAAEAIRFFHFYFMGNPEGLGFRYLKRDSMSAILDPLRARLESLGGEVRTGVVARRLLRQDDRVVAVEADGSAPPLPPLRVPLAEVPEGTWRTLDDGGAPLFITRRGGEVVALDGRCTHMGCPVRWDQDASSFRCPCHNGRYDAQGTPVEGPPKRPLGHLPVVTEGDSVTVGGQAVAGPGGAERIECDYCVAACEVRGLRQLVLGSDLGAAGADLSARVSRLGEADPYAVVRFWLDKPVAPHRDPFYTTSGFPYTDSIAVYSQFQEPYITWARENHGSVVECHAYAIAPSLAGPVSRYRDALLAELRAALPELAEARVLHEEAMAQDNFTRFAPGDHARRPQTETGVANLLLAGDHVALPVPAFLMEAAAMSGRMAANAVLRAEGLQEMDIPYVAASGPLP